jgi:hypothetical protein
MERRPSPSQMVMAGRGEPLENRERTAKISEMGMYRSSARRDSGDESRVGCWRSEGRVVVEELPP